MTIRKYFNYVCMAFFAYLLLFSSVGRSQEMAYSRQMYLQQRLNRLAIIIAQSKQELNLLDNQLTTSQNELTTAKAQLVVLKSELQESGQKLAKQKKLLESVEQYSKNLEKNQALPTLNEYSLSLSLGEKIDGFAYGRYWKIPNNPAYIGFKGTYEWKDKETGLWVSVLI